MEGEARGRADGFIQPSCRHNLRQVMLLRNIAVVGQAFAIVVVVGCLSIALPIAALASVTGFLALFNAATFWRLQRPTLVSDLELSGQLLVDVCALTALLYFSGGASNPFVGLLLVPVAISAATLPRLHALFVVLPAMACYSLLVLFQVPLHTPDDSAQGLQLEALGRWVSFPLTAGLIAYFVLAMAKQRELSDAHLARVGFLAAGAAHEIRSSLSTMAVLVKELLLMRQEDRTNLTHDLRIMSDQIEACRNTLSDLVEGGGDGLAEGATTEPVDEFLRKIVDRWRALRPGAKLSHRWTGPQPPPQISTERSLRYAIANLLNNAADASPGSVEMICQWSPEELRILILDRGPGISYKSSDMPGTLFTKRDEGTGIGLLLASTAIQKSGGSLKILNRTGGGARAEVFLPLENTREAGAAQTVKLRA